MYPLDYAQAFVDNLKNAGKDAKLFVVKGELTGRLLNIAH